jgi:hypothetical protein
MFEWASETEVPVAAFLIRQNRIDCSIVQVHDILAGIALVVLVHEVAYCGGYSGAISLDDDLGACVDCFLNLDHAVLRGELIVIGIQLETVFTKRGSRIGPVNEKPEVVQRGFRNAGHAARERIDEGKLDGPGLGIG